NSVYVNYDEYICKAIYQYLLGCIEEIVYSDSIENHESLNITLQDLLQKRIIMDRFNGGKK
ncbi:MAG: hypothetical protein V1870_02625, partial [Candidatus Aenigmatarchaeota archaeon]